MLALSRRLRSDLVSRIAVPVLLARPRQSAGPSSIAFTYPQPDRRTMASSAPAFSASPPKPAVQHPPPPGVIVLGLERITQLLARLNNPHTHFPIIHVAGTNAKGSTTAYLDALLSKAIGLRTGRFNSPHLVTERDTCSLNAGSQIIPAEVWHQASALVRAADQQDAALACTSFELLTATAFQAFDLLTPPLRPELLIIEVGLGGTLDATNVFPARNVLASIVCPVDLDHESLLGSTLQEIATAKAGIIKPGGLCILADQRRSETRQHSMEGHDQAALVASTAVATLGAETGALGPSAAVICDTVASVCAQLAEQSHSTDQPSVASSARLVRAVAPLQALPGLRDSNPLPTHRSAWQPHVNVRLTIAPTLCTPSAAILRYDDDDDFAVGGSRRAVQESLAQLQGVSFVPDPAIHPDAYGADEDGDQMDEIVQTGSIGSSGAAADLLADLSTYDLVLPATRASLSAASTALTALHAIASDSPFLAPGSAQRDIHSRDPWETIRLQIAYGLNGGTTDEPRGSRVKRVLEGGVRWPGRCEWVSIVSAHEEVVLKPVLLDGAHNPSSASALQHYLFNCIKTRLAAWMDEHGDAVLPVVEVTWIMSFSNGKDIRGMLDRLLRSPTVPNDASPSAGVELAASISGLSLHSEDGGRRQPISIKQHVGLCAFATPVEGMPWVRPADPTEVRDLVQDVLRTTSGESAGDARLSAGEVHVFDSLAQTLEWAGLPKYTDGAGVPVLKVAVVCGSLYLVGECYSLTERPDGQRWRITPL